MNVADSELVITILSTAGHTLVSDINEAELIMFNTCSVRAHAEDRVLGRISNERHRKKSEPIPYDRGIGMHGSENREEANR